jgi:hypothetical protein
VKLISLKTLSLATATALLFSACGGSGSSPDAEIKTGYFIDAPVSGVDYICGTKEGTTGSSGEFLYPVGSDCIFSLGANNSFEVFSSEIEDDGYVTPYDMTNSSEEAQRLAFVIQNVSSKDENGNLTIIDEVTAELDKIDLSTSDDSVATLISTAQSSALAKDTTLDINTEASSVLQASIAMLDYVNEDGSIVSNDIDIIDDDNSIVPSTPPTVPDTTTDDIADYDLPGA